MRLMFEAVMAAAAVAAVRAVCLVAGHVEAGHVPDHGAAWCSRCGRRVS